MANHFPTCPPMFVANVQYFIRMTPVSGNVSASPQQTIALVNFGFERVDPGTGAVTFDYTGFDQDTYETQLHSLLNSICAQWASSLGTDIPTVQSAMAVERTWTFNGDPGYSMTDTMAYP